MECTGRLLNRYCALEVLQTLWALPTTVLPFMPSLRDRLSNRWRDLLWLVAFAALNLDRCRRRDVVGPELPVVGKERPHGACVLVCQCHCRDVRIAPMQQTG